MIYFMSTITFIDFEINIKRIVDFISSLKYFNYVQLINFICNDIVFEESSISINAKSLADYLFEDIEHRDVKSIEDDIWWTICRMIFKEHYKLTKEVEPITISNVNKNGTHYVEFKFLKFKDSKMICDGIVSHQQIEFTDSSESADVSDSEEQINETDQQINTETDQQITENDLISINSVSTTGHKNNVSFSCIGDSVANYGQTSEEIINDDSERLVKSSIISNHSSKKSVNNNIEEMDENEFTKKYNELSDVDKFIVKHINWFKVGVALDDFLLRGQSPVSVGMKVSKYCDRITLTTKQYKSHIEEHRLTLGDRFTTRVPSRKTAIQLYMLKDPKLSKHAGYLFRMAKRIQQQS